jgi:hypothetical protein
MHACCSADSVYVTSYPRENSVYIRQRNLWLYAIRAFWVKYARSINQCSQPSGHCTIQRWRKDARQELLAHRRCQSRRLSRKITRLLYTRTSPRVLYLLASFSNFGQLSDSTAAVNLRTKLRTVISSCKRVWRLTSHRYVNQCILGNRAVKLTLAARCRRGAIFKSVISSYFITTYCTFISILIDKLYIIKVISLINKNKII